MKCLQLEVLPEIILRLNVLEDEISVKVNVTNQMFIACDKFMTTGFKLFDYSGS